MGRGPRAVGDAWSERTILCTKLENWPRDCDVKFGHCCNNTSEDDVEDGLGLGD